MSTKNENKTKGRRSSLKPQDNNQLGALKVKNKRNSVSWGQSNTFQFKAMKAMFQESNDLNKPVDEKKHKQFLETRKKSIKNEFSIVKELLKKQNAIEEVEEEENVKENTENNIKMGKDFQNCENEKNNFEEQNINQDTFEDIDCPKTNREELQQLEEKKKEINQTCKFC